jgi:hypothetical protein
MGSKDRSTGQVDKPMSLSAERNIVIAQGEIFELTGLRGVAALMVALLHFNFDVAGRFGPIYDNLTRVGFLGVDLFFILSGFVIAYKYHDIRRFWSRDYAQFLWFGSGESIRRISSSRSSMFPSSSPRYCSAATSTRRGFRFHR